jgi:hypothetical protein
LYANEDGQYKNLPSNTAATIIFERPLVGNVVMVAYTDEMARELDINDDDVLSPLDDMMDRARERLEEANLRNDHGDLE